MAMSVGILFERLGVSNFWSMSRGHWIAKDEVGVALEEFEVFLLYFLHQILAFRENVDPICVYIP
jgi:hypothetical protein